MRTIIFTIALLTGCNAPERETPKVADPFAHLQPTKDPYKDRWYVLVPKATLAQVQARYEAYKAICKRADGDKTACLQAQLECAELYKRRHPEDNGPAMFFAKCD